MKATLKKHRPLPAHVAHTVFWDRSIIPQMRGGRAKIDLMFSYSNGYWNTVDAVF